MDRLAMGAAVGLLLVGFGVVSRPAPAGAQPHQRPSANRLCADWVRLVEDNGPMPVADFDPDRPAVDQLPAVGAHFMPVVDAAEEMADRLRARTRGDRRLRAFVAALDAENANARAQAEAALAGDAIGFRATLAAVDGLQSARVRAARALGAPACTRR